MAPFVPQRYAETVFHIGIDRFLVAQRAKTRHKMEREENVLTLLHKMPDQRIVRNQKIIRIEIRRVFDLLIIRKAFGIEDRPLKGSETFGFKLQRVHQIVLECNDRVEPLFTQTRGELVKRQTFERDLKSRILLTTDFDDLRKIIGGYPAEIDPEMKHFRGHAECVARVRKLRRGALKEIEIRL